MSNTDTEGGNKDIDRIIHCFLQQKIMAETVILMLEDAKADKAKVKTLQDELTLHRESTVLRLEKLL